MKQMASDGVVVKRGKYWWGEIEDVAIWMGEGGKYAVTARARESAARLDDAIHLVSGVLEELPAETDLADALRLIAAVRSAMS